MKGPQTLKQEDKLGPTTNTITPLKLLIGISTQSALTFVSRGWGGHVSDVLLTESCGFLQTLLKRVLVLADRSFTVQESAGVCGAEVKIPAFTRRKGS